jgi:hypothetical protein
MSAPTNSSKSWLAITGICLGSLGLIVCIAAIIFLWIASIRLNRVTETLFSNMDQSLVAIQQRVAKIQDRLSTASSTANDIEEMLRNWAQQEIGQRLASRKNVVERTEQVASALQQADQWLEIAGTSATLIQQLLSVNSSTSVDNDSPIGDRLIEGIASVRAQLPETIEAFNNIGTRLANANQQETDDGNIEQTAQITLRAVATLSSISSRLDALVLRLKDSQSQLQELKTRTQAWHLVLAIAATLFILLMAAGQISLC